MDSQKKDESSPDRNVFVRLLMRHDRSIRAFLRSLLPTSSDVDEVMQDVSVVAWRKFGELDDPENFGRWVCMISRYEVLAYRRKKARDRFVLGEEIEQLIVEEGLEELSLRQQQLDALEGCLGKLAAEPRELLMRVYSAENPMKTIAEQIGKSPEALYKSLSRLRRTLMQCVERTLVEENC